MVFKKSTVPFYPGKIATGEKRGQPTGILHMMDCDPYYERVDLVEVDAKEVWEEELEYRGYETRRSAVRFEFYGLKTNRTYSMRIGILHNLMPSMRTGGRLEMMWTFEKKGAYYGIIPAAG